MLSLFSSCSSYFGCHLGAAPLLIVHLASAWSDESLAPLLWGSSSLPSKDHLGKVVHLLLPHSHLLLPHVHRLLSSLSAPASPEIFWNVLLLMVFLYLRSSEIRCCWWSFWNLLSVLLLMVFLYFFFLLEWVVAGGASEIFWNVFAVDSVSVFSVLLTAQWRCRWHCRGLRSNGRKWSLTL